MVRVFEGDIVRRRQPPERLGLVIRSSRDDSATNEGLSALVGGMDPKHADMLEPLADGEVLVTFDVGGTERTKAKEDDLVLVDRSLRLGEPVKKEGDDSQSGVVVKCDVQLRLAHAISGQKLPGWVNSREVDWNNRLGVGSYVVHSNWVGQVVDAFDEVYVQLGDGEIKRLGDGGRLAVGDRGKHILPPLTQDEEYHPQATHEDLVIHIQRLAYAISWLAVSQMVPVSEAATLTRPKKIWTYADLSQLTPLDFITQTPSLEHRVSLNNKNLAGSKGILPTRHGKDEPSQPPVIEVSTMVVRETKTKATVLWQDGNLELCESIALYPNPPTDTYDCCPGDHAIWKSEGVSRHVVVQSANAVQRTAKVLFLDTKRIELVSTIELDTVGPAVEESFSEGYGVHVGDLVFAHSEGSSNGLLPPSVPSIGEPDSSMSFMMEMVNIFPPWRQELHEAGRQALSQNISYTTPLKFGNERVNWLGEVSKLHLDGNVEVKLADNTFACFPLQRLSKLNDPFAVEADGAMGVDVEGLEEDDMGYEHGELFWPTELQSTNHIAGAWEDEYEDEDDDEYMEDTDDVMSEDLIPHPPEWIPNFDSGLHIDTDGNPHLPGSWHHYPDSSDVPSTQSQPSTDNDSHVPPENKAEAEMAASEDHAPRPENEVNWERFSVLPSAPQDHAFLSEKTARPSKTFMSRLQKEFRVLRTSLPDTIVVRAYEDRTDLLRSLIFGPENTPYQNAPFVIDWYLESEFPQAPPRAHFHSWTQGNGRVNPNLYEEGKVCLSILGTWGGDHSESWNAARSSLLQAFVSIQGLVLVKEPWYCEPGFEKQRGTREAAVSSRQYSEKAYILSLGFIRRALTVPPQGLEGEIHHFYRIQGKLDQVINDANALVEQSLNVDGGMFEHYASQSDDAVPLLSHGGIIAINRVLPRLTALQQPQPLSQTQSTSSQPR